MCRPAQCCLTCPAKSSTLNKQDEGDHEQGAFCTQRSQNAREISRSI
jgi:hypothetical protein